MRIGNMIPLKVVSVTIPSIEDAEDLKDDELKHDAWERKGDGEYELDGVMVNLIVPKEVLHEKHPTTGKEDDLHYVYGTTYWKMNSPF